ncbi:tRNA 5-methoxyuridine(34)/uridine 5-oxyacetic acid(34) synthase CmoB [Larsenimonas salina]|uniref:tRNA 5-methoxyuridine(34)/uridine 5-oxyacetic acid(34) synthase CmoB n=1 Tax=Larsenimonas salina TaxID=1295565 RepID=UPI002072D249|nr:tRNA 5-methoxyuridine(34)/uridine 5-oxyacetic acid(34) synthase CmoB [Larsenimonas salina]MCM5704829.1 tRNA 5-methoxyuridine(34)/uridine 5-oxyacetic acid(34) synthase CmoB [Larsenimonas salina]
MTLSKREQALYQAVLDQELPTWLARLPDQLAHGLDTRRHGDLPGWLRILDKFPALDGVRIDLNAPHVTIDAALPDGLQTRCHNLLQALAPWRKGPYRVGTTVIDTEWRSDWKWDRLAPHLSDLTHRRVLDVGGGNGYHGFRMAGAGAAFVLVIDPSPRFYCQFHAIKQLMGTHAPNVHFIPVGIEDVPTGLASFDTTFSMGVLYHRRSPLDHLLELRDTLRPGGELVLETLVVEGDENTVLVPGERYAQMPNVYFLPSSRALAHWLKRCGFSNVRVVDEAPTSLEEQRATDWMTYQSLKDFLDPEDPTRTVEGHPAPRRAVVIAERD